MRREYGQRTKRGLIAGFNQYGNKHIYNIVEDNMLDTFMGVGNESRYIGRDVGDNRFYTGNEVFDEIVNLSYGTAVVVLDETMHEGRLFLLNLLKNHPVAEVVSKRQSPIEKNKLCIEVDNPQDVSIQLSRLRKNPFQRVLIHTYLHELVVRYGEETVLRLVDNILSDIKRTGNIEFFLLPKGTFANFERKLMAVVDGALEISVHRLQSGVEYAFTPIRISTPEYHLKPVSYFYDKDELKIFPGKTVVSTAVVEELAKKLSTDREGVLAWGVTAVKKIPVSEYFMVKELAGLRLAWIGEIFQDMSRAFYLKLAEYVYNGYLAVEKKAPTSLKERLRNYISMMRILTRPESVAFLGELCSLLDESHSQEEAGKKIRGMREFFARLYVYAMQYTADDYRTAVENILETVIGGDVRVRKKTENTYMLEVKDCKLCRESFLMPNCGKSVADLVKGVTGCVLGAGVEVSETECISQGGKRCFFQLQVFRELQTKT